MQITQQNSFPYNDLPAYSDNKEITIFSQVASFSFFPITLNSVVETIIQNMPQSLY